MHRFRSSLQALLESWRAALIRLGATLAERSAPLRARLASLLSRVRVLPRLYVAIIVAAGLIGLACGIGMTLLIASMIFPDLGRQPTATYEGPTGTPLPVVTSTPIGGEAEVVATDYPAPADTAYPPPRTPTPGATPPPEATMGPRQYLPWLWSDAPTPTPPVTATRVPPTPTPQPTATPTPPWPASLEEPSRSKLGLHVQWNNHADIMEFARRYKPAVMKGMDDLGFLEEVKQVSPQTVTVGRYHFDPSNLPEDPVAAARSFVDQHLQRYLDTPWVDYWEGINEPGVEGRMAWLAAFEAERVRLMAQHGLRCAIGSFSTGVPEWPDFADFLPAVRAAKQHGGVLALHEYDAPTMQRSVGMALPGRPGYPDRGTLTLRYRWWYNDYLIPNNLVIPLIMTEAGVDGAVNPPEAQGKGWMDFTGYWHQQGLGDDAIKIYVDQLAWYDREIQQDSYVIGATIFTAGPMSDEWNTYDVTPILRQLATYIITQR